MQSNSAKSQTIFSSIFDQVVDRKQSNCLKWDGGDMLLTPDEVAADPLPMWVADMDFKAPQAVLDALAKRVEHGVFGYPSKVSKSYQEAVLGWQAKRFDWEVDPSWLIQSSGIITAIKTAVQAFTSPGDSVLIQPPVYSHFNDDVVLNGRQVNIAPLDFDGEQYHFNAQTFEAAITDNTKIFIFSHPHNPTGNLWSEEELRQMGEICLKHNILVFSDEIHQDLILNPLKKHIPFASLSDAFAQNCITCTAPSKTFNLPGLQCANLFIANKSVRENFVRQYARNMFPLVNVMGLTATEAAYSEGEAWLEELLVYLRGNHDYFASEINGFTDKLKVLPTESLYLAWIDCRGLGMDAAQLDKFMLTKAKIWFDKGQKFGMAGHGFMRINLGCPRSTVEEAVARLKAAI